MAAQNFKVLIAGGSIAGLVLANMLQQLGIDFLVLEAYPEIAPQVGASIGFFPNGNRILDQLGLFDDIRAKLDREMTNMYFKSPEGIALSTTKNGAKHFIARHGYDPVFIDRQMAIEVLYDHIKEKSKVLVNRRVVGVEPFIRGVKVTTQDGSTYTGDILVGADGVHSQVRKEMWRLGDNLSPGYFARSDQTDVTCDYTCMFGISHHIDGFEEGSTHVVLNHKRSYLVIDGPGGRIYWFLFIKNEKTLRNMEAEIPRRYTKEEEKAVAEKYRDDPISGPAKFGDLYKNKMSSVLTALPEFVCTKWHFGRITIIGDAAHKFNPISGQGGNSAIETAAVLATNVAQMVKAQSDGGSPSDADITVAFQKTQETRRDRVANMVEAGHKQQSLSALETPIAEILGTKIAPRMGLEGSLSMFADNILPAERLPMLPMPKRPRFEPFQDELPAKPLGWQKATMAIAAVNFAILLLVAKKGMKIDSELLGWDEKASEFLGHSLRTHYTGLSSVDKMLATLSSCFGHSVFGPDPSHTAQFAYLLSLLAPVLVIWSIEGYRSANKLMPVALPVLFGIAYQLQGIGVIAPLYFLLSVWTTSTNTYTRAVGRPVPVAAAKSVLPATLLGYAVPTALMFLPFANAHKHQGVIAVWQFTPVWVALLTALGKRGLEKLQPPTQFDMYAKADVAPLRDAYKVTFWMSVTLHVTFVTFIALTSLPTVSFANVFADLPNPLSDWSRPTWEEHLFVFVKYDLLFGATAIAQWCLYSVWEIRRIGFTTTKQALVAALAVVLGQVVVGPGATYAGLWYWREGQWAREADLQGRDDEKSRQT